MKFKMISLMPELIAQALQFGVVGKAFQKGLCEIQYFNPRNHAEDNHKTVDDRPFGGGDGMLMMAEPLQRALDASDSQGKVFYLSPHGAVLDDKRVKSLAQEKELTLICGRYGGVDQRFLVRNKIQEISIGDYVLSGGELPALVLIDALTRQIPGVLGHTASAPMDSFADDLLEAPSYTRPSEWAGMKVPSVLLSGDHKRIETFRHLWAQLVTVLKRPDLWQPQSPEERRSCLSFLNSLSKEEIQVMGLESGLVEAFLNEK